MQLYSILLLLVFGFSAHAKFEVGKIYHGSSSQEVQVGDIQNKLSPGTILILSERHNSKEHHQNQRDFIVKTSGAPFPISVGMEFLAYPFQHIVNQYGVGQISEKNFLNNVLWGGNDFGEYRFQVKYPYYKGGIAVALNAPRKLTSQIAKLGPASLTDVQKKFLPPNFTLGNVNYLKRFKTVMGGHIDEKKFANYFYAQSVWDDTMAWKATEFLTAHPGQLLIIIVGDFHVAYGGGLPDRLKLRGNKKVVTVSQISINGMSEEQIDKMVKPSKTFGPRADFVWVSDK